MTRTTRTLVLTVAALGLVAGAGGQAGDHSDHGTPGPHAGMNPGMNQGHMHDMMNKMTPETKMQFRMMMGTAIGPNDPQAILALKDQLKLTDDQSAQLQAILRETRQKASAVLNADQKKTLASLPQTPQTMKDMHEQMMGKMQSMTGQPMTCPMMDMMKENGPAAQPAQPPATTDHSAHH